MFQTKSLCVVALISLMVFAGCINRTSTTRNPQNEALMRAAREGHADTVRAMLSAEGVDVNATDENGNTPLIEAARFGHDDVVRVLLTSGANPNIKNRDGKTALMLAAQGGHDDVVRVLRQAGVKE